MTRMRQYISSNNDPQDEEKQADDITSEHFDSSFKSISDKINSCRRKTSRFTRISGNKYNISVVDSEVKGNATFLEDTLTMESYL